LITLVLQQSGLEVATATNGKEGVDRACSETFDLIMMDMQMPVMDGYTAARILRQRGFSLPIVALTAHAMKGDEQKCLEAGCSDFLTKPINIDLLLQKISDILHRSGQSSQAVSSSQHVPSSRTAATSTSGELVEDAADSAAVSSKQVGLSTSETRLRSKLPLHHPQFRAIVAKFVIRLDQQLHQMEQALAAGDYRELASLGHWLKGTGGTVGFSEFSAPSLRLEQAATARQHDQCTSLLLELRQLAQSIDLAEECDTTTVKQPSRGESKLIGV
jgi:CheY-like chemotaxis protein